ncbi:MAG: hypothetical protein IKK83_02945 [Clostridia bacterium]|nr:hypothetical protein [Clostridia bacterium]
MKKTGFKKGYFRRLRDESLILSCLGGLSSRLIYFLKVSIISYLFSGSDISDQKLEESALYTSVKTYKVKEKGVRTVKNACASAIEHGFTVGLYRRLLTKFIYMPLSTYGAFLVTYGVYVGLVYFVKLYAFDKGAEFESLVSGCIIILMALPLTLIHKPLVASIGESAFFRSVLSGCIHFDSYKGEKQHGAVGVAIIAGSLLGVLAFFCDELMILALLGLVALALVVLYTPELGLFLAAALFPFMERSRLVALICFTYGAYLVKVLRSKRNLHLNTGSIFVLLLNIYYGFAVLKGGGMNALSAFSVTAVYFLCANLLCTRALLTKCVQSLALGFSGVLLMFCNGVLKGGVAGLEWYDAIRSHGSVFESGAAMSAYIALILPFVFCKVERHSATTCYLLTVAGIVYGVFTGNVFLSLMTAATVTLYLAVSRRQFFRPLTISFGIPLAIFYFASFRISVGTAELYDLVQSWVRTAKRCSEYLIMGVGMSDRSWALGGFGDTSSAYLRTLAEGGVVGLMLLVLALVFACQRMYSVLPKRIDDRRIAAAASASAVSCIFMGFVSDIWANMDVSFALWLCLGLASAAYEYRMSKKIGRSDDYLEEY